MESAAAKKKVENSPNQRWDLDRGCPSFLPPPSFLLTASRGPSSRAWVAHGARAWQRCPIAMQGCYLRRATTSLSRGTIRRRAKSDSWHEADFLRRGRQFPSSCFSDHPETEEAFPSSRDTYRRPHLMRDAHDFSKGEWKFAAIVIGSKFRPHNGIVWVK